MRRLSTKRVFQVDADTIGGLTWAESALWLVDPGRETLLAVDRDTGSEIRRFPSPDALGALCAGGEALWLTVGREKPRLRRVDAVSGALIDERPLSLEAVPRAMSWDQGTLWIAAEGGHGLVRVDPDTAQVLGRTELLVGAAGVEVAEGSLWVTDPDAGQLLRVTPAGEETGRFPVEGRPTALAFDGWLYWYADGTRLRAVRP
jgi:sugar lactone lactonase YvrE